MGKLMVGVARVLPLCTVLLSFTLLVPTEAYAQEAISVSPSSGPVGQAVIVNGTGWHEHGVRGLDVPIEIGFANEVARGHPDANGEFSVSFVIPLNPPPEEFINGRLRISAIIGNGGGANAFYTVTAGQGQLPPEIVRVETFVEEPLVFFRVFYTDPNNDAEGFGFVGSIWAEEEHPFSSPSYGRWSPGVIEYPFNHGCGTGSEIESDVEVWIYDSAGLISQSETVHLACSAPSKPSQISYFALGDSVASGHGLKDDAKTCRQSDRGYPYKVRDHLATRYTTVDFHGDLNQST